MRTAIGTLELLEPKTLGTALKLLRTKGPLTPLAGCTDLYVVLNAGALTSRRYLDLSQLGPLKRIRMEGETLVIGAMATHTDIIRSRHVRRMVPMLVSAAREVGGLQIQNRGTIGGNIANASPAGDTLPALAAADAVVVLESVDGQRKVPFNAFYAGYRTTVMQPDELIVAIEIAPIEGAQWFRKVGTRAAQAISKVVMAAVRGPRVRVALGSVAATTIRLPQTEAALESGSINDARRVLMSEIHPIDDVRSTAEYRLQVAANLLAQFWAETAAEGPKAES